MTAPLCQPTAEHTPTPWRVFTTTDGRKIVGIGDQEGQGILDCGFGVWAWNDAEGIANANLVVKAVNSHAALTSRVEELEKALRNVQKIISEAALVGFNHKDGDWPERLFHSQQATSRALKGAA